MSSHKKTDGSRIIPKFLLQMALFHEEIPDLRLIFGKFHRECVVPYGQERLRDGGILVAKSSFYTEGFAVFNGMV